jgi:hypothetical protein
VQGGHDLSALADGCRDPLHGFCAHVADGKYPPFGCFQRMVPVAGVLARENEALGVESDA